MMKPKKGWLKRHEFTLTVTTTDNRRQAELAILAAFSGRQPDNCFFDLSRSKLKVKRLKNSFPLVA